MPHNLRLDANWSDALRRLGLTDAHLVSISQFDPYRRVYFRNECVYKIALDTTATDTPVRQQTLAGEAAILKRCKRINGVPEIVSYFRRGNTDVLVARWIEGKPLDTVLLGVTGTLAVLLQLGYLLLQLSFIGISHNDVLPKNILVSGSKIYLIDFDQARHVSIPRALFGNFIGKSTKHMDSFGSFTHTSIRLFKRLPVFRQYRHVLKLDVPALAADASPALRSLSAAWLIGQISNANAPGAGLCYYSLDFDGYHFPGERPWEARWVTLKTITTYRDKRILELGCNLGLLSCHLLRESGASDVLAVDADAEILAGAQCVAAAYEVAPQLRQFNFDAAYDWESNLSAFQPDIVFALSVLNWVTDKERVMKFLGGFNEVIFEGHDAEDVEHQRFRDVGFDTIKTIAYSERERPIMHAQKSSNL